MAFFDTTWYINAGNMTNTGFYAMAQWTANTAYTAGQMIRGLATPASGSERARICIIAGTSHATTEPTWTNTRGAKNTDGTVTWQECTGQSAVNGDVTNTPNWTTVRNQNASLGVIIKNNSATHFFICSTAGTTNNTGEPTWNTTAGQTTTDGGATWTCIGAVGNFTGWQAPFVHPQSAYTANWGIAGNTFFIASEHASSSTLSASEGPVSISPTTMSFLYCVDKNNVPPGPSNITTGATVSTTGSQGISFTGRSYINGVTYQTEAGANSAAIAFINGGASGNMSFENCAFKKRGTTGATSSITIGSGNNPTTATDVKWKNCTVEFGNTADTINMTTGNFTWTDTANAVTGATLPTLLFNSGGGSTVMLEAVDLSALGSGKTLFSGANSGTCKIHLKDCKLDNAATIMSAPTTIGGPELFLTRTNASALNYNHLHYKYIGQSVTDTTVIRTGGASDGTTSISWKVTTIAGTKWKMPYDLLPITVWNPTTGADVNVTIEGVLNGTALPNNDEFWFDLEYQGSASSPQGTFKTGGKATGLTTATALTASTQAWDTQATARANSTAYALGDVIKTASNSGRIFFCTTAGTTAGSEPGGYASAVDGGSVTDNTAVFTAGVRFKLTVTATSPQPQLVGVMYAYAKCAKASSTFYIDPELTLS